MQALHPKDLYFYNWPEIFARVEMRYFILLSHVSHYMCKTSLEVPSFLQADFLCLSTLVWLLQRL